MFQSKINQLGERLTKPLPGLEKFLEMAPENRRRKTVAEARARGCREGSVLFLLYPIEGVAHTVLTVRSASLRTHAGQISLPGGRIDPGEDAVQAALREAWEELDIMADQLEVLGSLSELYIPPSNYCLVPIVAATSRRPHFRPNEREVAELLELPIDYFIGPTNRRAETWTIQGQPLRIPFFQYRSHKIWGATAMILTEMAALWEEIGD